MVWSCRLLRRQKYGHNPLELRHNRGVPASVAERDRGACSFRFLARNTIVTAIAPKQALRQRTLCTEAPSAVCPVRPLGERRGRTLRLGDGAGAQSLGGVLVVVVEHRRKSRVRMCRSTDRNTCARPSSGGSAGRGQSTVFSDRNALNPGERFIGAHGAGVVEACAKFLERLRHKQTAQASRGASSYHQL